MHLRRNKSGYGIQAKEAFSLPAWLIRIPAEVEYATLTVEELLNVFLDSRGQMHFNWEMSLPLWLSERYELLDLTHLCTIIVSVVLLFYELTNQVLKEM